MQTSDWIALAACVATFLALIPAFVPLLTRIKSRKGQEKVSPISQLNNPGTVLNGDLGVNDELSVIRSFALKLAKADGAVFTWDGIHHDSYALQNGSWEEWITGLNSGMISDPTVNFSNYGFKYYFLDLVSLKKIQIPTGVETKRRVGDDIKNGMVLMRKEIDKA